ncbi:MAG: hypothetical protein MZW92_02475 [Comamonadaceae bacterium]|nr:hypothetical protein [Comamonadaceae bacterium]
MKIGFYPGSFDPITFGHLDIIDRGAEAVRPTVRGDFARSQQEDDVHRPRADRPREGRREGFPERRSDPVRHPHRRPLQAARRDTHPARPARRHRLRLRVPGSPTSTAASTTRSTPSF